MTIYAKLNVALSGANKSVNTIVCLSRPCSDRSSPPRISGISSGATTPKKE